MAIEDDGGFLRNETKKESHSTPTFTSYRNERIKVGDNIWSLETGWIGQIVDWDKHNGDLMLECKCVSLVTDELEDDDTQWFAPADVYLVTCCMKAKHTGDWDERAGGALHCPECGKKIAFFRQ